MKEFWNAIQLIFTVLGGWIGYFLGGCDGLLIALVAFAAIDYITGCGCPVDTSAAGRSTDRAGRRERCVL